MHRPTNGRSYVGTAPMGKVIVSAKVENLEDLYDVHKGRLTPDKVRTLDVPDALVDTGAVGLMIPTRLLPALGLRPAYQKQARSVSGVFTMQVYEVVRLTIQGRECKVEVFEVPDPNPVLIGQVPLEMLDWVIDPRGQELIGNPEHGGQHIIDVLGVS
jgi:clan AA aspartic protease